MKEGPDVSIIAALIGNPASANMLMALMAGPALTATELAQEAGLMLSTAADISRSSKGRSRRGRTPGAASLFPPRGSRRRDRTRGADAAGGPRRPPRIRTGPRDPELRRARSCYDHLAGDLAVRCSIVSWNALARSAAATACSVTRERAALFRRRRHRYRRRSNRAAAAMPALASIGASAGSSRRSARRRRFSIASLRSMGRSRGAARGSSAFPPAASAR